MRHVMQQVTVTLRIVALVTVAYSCGAGGDASDPGVVSLRGRILGDTASIGVPGGVVPLRDMLVVLDQRGGTGIHILDDAGNYIGGLGRRGEGPGEFAAPWDIAPDRGRADVVWIYDAQLSRLTPLFLEALRAGEPAPFGEPIRLSTPVLVGAPQWIDDSRLVALAPMLVPEEGRFRFYGRDGSDLGSSGDPPPGDVTVPTFVRQQIFGGRMAIHPRRPWVVVASAYAPRLEVFDGDGKSQLVIQGPTSFDPDFSVAPDGINIERGRNFRFGYIDVAATAEHIYGLFSGRKRADYPETQNLADLVHVFTWDGKLLRTFRLDTDAFTLDVDVERRRLVVGRLHPYPQIVIYDLPESMQP